METNIWKIEKDLCRCCHTEGSFKNLAEPCTEMGQEEIYCDMLRDSFDIDLTPVPGNLCAPTYTICETCIHRLRDAAVFKKQVLCCEKKFREMYSKNVIIAAAPPFLFDVKQEPDPSDDYMKYEMMGLDSDDSGDDKASLDIKCKDSDNSDEEDDYKLSTLEGSKKKGKVAQKRQKTTKAKKSQKKVKTKKEKAADEDCEEGDDADGDEEKPKKKEPLKQRTPKFRLSETDYKWDGEVYLCGKCDKRYNKFLSLRHHLRTKHYSMARYQCPYCKRAFMTPAPLTVHKLEEHNVDERFRCNACKGAFNTKVQLKKHINNFHMLGTKHKCEFCDYESFSFEGMYKHKFKHRTVKDYHCKFCEKSFLRKSTLDLHERIHTGDRRKVCKVCGQAFVQKASLNYHMSKYHPEVNF